jgi:hypothetical protein
MPTLTWNEFKEHIDKQLEENGIDPNTEIWYIDTTCPSKGEPGEFEVPEVSLNEIGIAIA